MQSWDIWRKDGTIIWFARENSIPCRQLVWVMQHRYISIHVSDSTSHISGKAQQNMPWCFYCTQSVQISYIYIYLSIYWSTSLHKHQQRSLQSWEMIKEYQLYSARVKFSQTSALAEVWWVINFSIFLVGWYGKSPSCFHCTKQICGLVCVCQRG